MTHKQSSSLFATLLFITAGAAGLGCVAQDSDTAEVKEATAGAALTATTSQRGGPRGRCDSWFERCMDRTGNDVSECVPPWTDCILDIPAPVGPQYCFWDGNKLEWCTPW